MKRTKQEATDTKDKIFTTARKLFFDAGYNATSLRQIAKAAGLTQGAISWHFKDKKDLAYTLLKRRDREAVTNLEILNRLDIPPTIKAKIMVYSNIPEFKSRKRLMNYFRLKMEFTSLFREKGGQKFADTFTQSVTGFLCEAKRKRELKKSINEDIASYTLSALLAGVYLRYSAQANPFPKITHSRKLIDDYFNLICTPKGSQLDFTAILNSIKNKFKRDEKFF